MGVKRQNTKGIRDGEQNKEGERGCRVRHLTPVRPIEKGAETECKNKVQHVTTNMCPPHHVTTNMCPSYRVTTNTCVHPIM